MSAVGEPPDEPASDPARDDDEQSAVDAEQVIRHRIDGHKAALKMAHQVDDPEALAPQIEETEHRLAEDEDILDELAPE